MSTRRPLLTQVPKVFENCTRVVSPAEQQAARDSYWRVVTELAGPEKQARAQPRSGGGPV